MKTTNPLAIFGILLLLLSAVSSIGCGQGDQVEASTDDTRGGQEVAQTATDDDEAIVKKQHPVFNYQLRRATAHTTYASAVEPINSIGSK